MADTLPDSGARTAFEYGGGSRLYEGQRYAQYDTHLCYYGYG